jgi:hypothetical protein
MRLIAVILSLLLFANVSGFGASAFPDTTKHKKLRQLTQKELEKAEKAHKDYYDDCTFVTKYPLVQRLKKYPYSKAAKILAVSYYCYCDDLGPNDNESTHHLKDKKGYISIVIRWITAPYWK